MTRVPHRPTRRLGLAAAAAVAVIALAGCGQTLMAGSAAVVGDTRITDAQVSDAATQVLDVLKGRAPEGDTGQLNRALISRYVTSSLIGAAAAKEGVTITPSEVEGTRQRIIEGIGGEQALPQYAAERSVPPAEVDDAILASLQYAALGVKLAPGGDEQAQADAVNSYLAALSKDLGTEVSPRFGTWDPTRLTVGLPPQDLARPPASGAAVPSPTAPAGAETPAPQAS